MISRRHSVRRPAADGLSNAGLGRGGNNHQLDEWSSVEEVRDHMTSTATYLPERARLVRGVAE